ncbi:MAG TPA: DUF1848 domain-containing protein [Candidatus Ozemobacteraceae bacterium]|nr:DUF1848 domain-containing protein [Candidatus Ozemobacteraceae bacterium]
MRRATGKGRIIETPEGPREAVAPVILSASRSTDIPAFYIPWLANRFRAGHLRWVNPFNNRSQYISLAAVRAIVFWSKDPRPLLALPNALDGVGWYLSHTLNGYENEGLEPGLPPLGKRLAAFEAVSRLVGPARVIWRADPLVLLDELGVDGLLERVRSVARRLRGLTERLVFSFADIQGYRRVARNMTARGVAWREWDEPSMRIAAAGMAEIGREFGFVVSSCAETVDLSAFGIRHGACIDGDLLRRLFPGDERLVRFLDTAPKDPGQRPACGCVMSKDIGRYNTCSCGCVYCYANVSPAAAARNARRHDPAGDAIVP